jgi:hypothetical protein
MQNFTVDKYEDMSREDLILCCITHDKHHAEHHARERELVDVLTSAHHIASRGGVDVNWKRFAARIKSMGIGNITAKTFRILAIDIEEKS